MYQTSDKIIYRVGQKMWHFTFVHIFVNYWSILKFFQLHILQTICNKVTIAYPITS